MLNYRRFVNRRTKSLSLIATLTLAILFLFSNCISSMDSTNSNQVAAVPTPTPTPSPTPSVSVTPTPSPTPSGVLWSTLGVKADNTTDNTAALNNLPTGELIIGDCPAGGLILLNSQWIWKSNLNLAIQPGCAIKSTLSTGGSGGVYAISQTDLSTPLTDITVDGLQISAPYLTQHRILMAYINNFTLTHWTVTQSGGLFFLRGSNQEIAYGTATNTYPDTGSPGIRHIGNCLDGYCQQYRDQNGASQLCTQTPCAEVATSAGRPANVYIHDNNLITGDGVYQACQPLTTNLWTNVGSNDILYQNNVGQSLASALILIGETSTGAGSFSAWSCTNITFDNVNEISTDFASGMASNWGVHLASSGSTNNYSNITVENSTMGNNSTAGGRPVIFIDAIAGGPMTNLNFEKLNIQYVDQVALTTYGPVSNLTFDQSEIAAPQVAGSAAIILSEDTSSSRITNNMIATKSSDGIQVGTDDNCTIVTNGGGQGPNTPSSNISISNNTITGIGNNYAGLRLANINQSTLSQNTLSSATGATSAIGIYFSAASGANGGTTNTTATANMLSAIVGKAISYASGQGNCATNNTGSANECN